MDFPQQQAQQITDALSAISDPVERAKATSAMLDSVPALQRALRELRQGAVQELRAQGQSHGEIGKALGLHRNRVQQIAEGRTGGKPAKSE